MNIFDNLVLPSSGAHMSFYHYLLALTLVLFLGYTAVFLGSAILSVVFRMIGVKDGKRELEKLSQDYVDIITSNRLIGIGLGMVPFLSSIFFYAQLLKGTQTSIPEYFLVAFVLYIAGWFAIYTYKRTMHLDNVFKTLRKSAANIESVPEISEFLKMNSKNSQTNQRAGIWGVLLLLVSMWIFVGCFTLAGDSQKWQNTNNIFNALFYMPGFIKYLHFISASIAAAGGFFIFLRYYSDSEFKVETPDEYDNYARKLNSTIALIMTLAQPVFFILNLILTPGTAISYSLFIITIVALGMTFAGSHFLYGVLKENKKKYFSYSFYSLVLVLGFFVVQQQSGFTFSNRSQELALATNYDREIQAEMEKLGRGAATVNGEEIFQTRCLPCHRFDQKLVGPAYNEVLGKYQGDKQRLSAFIMNPVKIDPNFPQMPNPGLKPKEADAVAEFLLKTFQGGAAAQPK